MALLEIYNENGVKQFDSDEQPFNLLAKFVLDTTAVGSGTRTMDGNTNSNAVVWQFATLNHNVPNAVIAFAGNGIARVGATSGLSATIQYVRYSGNMEIYVFGTGSVGGANSGFEMYLEDGTLTMTANDLPMRVVGGKTYALNNGPVDYTPITIPGVKLAGILNASSQVRSVEDDPIDQNNDRAYIGKMFLTGSGNGDTMGITDVTYITLKIPVDDEEPFAYNIGSYQVVDVTGF
jgi:hypothetical protein